MLKNYFERFRGFTCNDTDLKLKFVIPTEIIVNVTAKEENRKDYCAITFEKCRTAQFSKEDLTSFATALIKVANSMDSQEINGMSKNRFNAIQIMEDLGITAKGEKWYRIENALTEYLDQKYTEGV